VGPSTFLVALALSSALPAQEKESALEKLEREIVAVIEKVRPSVVQVTATFGLEPGTKLETLSFSGVVYSGKGHIVTDASALEQAAELSVRAGERTFKARHLASDRRTGVAVLHVEAAGLVPAVFAEQPCRSGVTAISVGNAFGMRGSAAVGTVSGVGRTIVVGSRTYDDMIQVSTAVHPGDCGGLVADAKGIFIGLVHSAYAAEGGEGLNLLQLFGKRGRDLVPVAPVTVGFATPASWVRFSADRIIRHGRMVRGWVGLSARPLGEAARIHLGLAEGQGAEVTRVEREGPAARAGVALKDVLVEFDGEPVRDLDALQWKIAQAETARPVQAVVLRNGERRAVEMNIEIDPQK
jgi:S1-C subfamily serine protease